MGLNNRADVVKECPGGVGCDNWMKCCSCCSRNVDSNMQGEPEYKDYFRRVSHDT